MKAPRIVVTAFEGPDALPAVYDAAFAQAEAISIDLGLAWYRNLIDTVYPDQPVTFVCAERAAGAAPAASLVILPVRVIRQGRQREIHSLSNYYSCLFAPVMAAEVSEDVVAGMVEHMTAAFAPVGMMRLAPMDPEAASFALLERGLRRAGWMSFRYFCFANWYLDVAGRNWETYLSTRSSELRSTLKRKGKKFLNDSGSLEIVSGGPALDDALAAYQNIYAASWKREEPYPAFIPGLVRLAAGKGWLRLGVARIQGRPVAAQIWLVAHGTANIYKLAYDEAYAGHSVGTLLTAHLMRHVMEVDRVATVDFLSGDDTYKSAWMSARRERWGIVAYNPRTLRGLAGLVREAIGRGARNLLGRLKK